MSFQGPGTGISGYSAQFTVGYANSAGNINGYAPQAGNANSLTVQGIGGTTWAWAGQPGTPNHFWGSNQGGYHAVWQMGQITVGTANYTNGNIGGTAPSATNINSAQGINGTNWAWAGQPGTPGWLWGSNQSGYYTVWQPGQITVGTANYTNGNIGGYAPLAGYTYGNIGGYAPVAGDANRIYANQVSYLRGYAIYSGNARLRGTGDDICIYGGTTNFPGGGGNAAIGISVQNFGRMACTGWNNNTNVPHSMNSFNDGWQWYISFDGFGGGENGNISWWLSNYFFLG